MERNQSPISANDAHWQAAIALVLVAASALAPSFASGGCGGGSTGVEQARSLQSVDTCTVWLESPQSSLRATVRDRRAVVSDGGRGTTPLTLEGGGQMACSPTNALLGGSALLFEALPRYSL